MSDKPKRLLSFSTSDRKHLHPQIQTQTHPQAQAEDRTVSVDGGAKMSIHSAWALADRVRGADPSVDENASNVVASTQQSAIAACTQTHACITGIFNRDSIVECREGEESPRSGTDLEGKEPHACIVVVCGFQLNGVRSVYHERHAEFMDCER